MVRERRRRDIQATDKKPLPKGVAYDPFETHFVSQNRRNEFLKSLEQNQRADASAPA